jgi:glyoxylase-like metal-dependent hydrolase (beta-lactamase superfamily II)
MLVQLVILLQLPSEEAPFYLKVKRLKEEHEASAVEINTENTFTDTRSIVDDTRLLLELPSVEIEIEEASLPATLNVGAPLSPALSTERLKPLLVKELSVLVSDEEKAAELAQIIASDALLIGRFPNPLFSRNRAVETLFVWCRHEGLERFLPRVQPKVGVSDTCFNSDKGNGAWLQAGYVLQLFNQYRHILHPYVLHLLKLWHYNGSVDSFLDGCRQLSEEKLVVGVHVPLEFSPGVHVIPILSNTLIPFHTTNLIMFYSGGEWVIVDPGASVDGRQHLAEVIRHYILGGSPTCTNPSSSSTSAADEPRVSVFITHHHHDHWEGLGVIEDLLPKARVVAHANTLARIKTKLETKVLVSGESLFANNNNKETGTSTAGSEDMDLVAFNAEGHTNGHMILFERKRRLIVAGDHVVGFGSAVLDLETGDMAQYFATTRFLISLQPWLIIPEHGDPNYQPIKLLQDYIVHRQAREDAILKVVKAGAKTADDIVCAVYKDVAPALREKAKSNVVLHLRKLYAEQKIPSST